MSIPFIKEENQKAYQQKEYNSVFTALYLICMTKGGGPHGINLKDNISNHLNFSNVGDNMKSLLGMLGLSRSKTCISISQDRAVDENIKAGWNSKGKGK